MMARLEVQLLGFPSLRLDGRGIDLALRKGLGLVAYLADARAPVGRDHMASLLWPEADAEAARSRLRRTLHKIRVAFAVDVIDADRTSLALAPSIEARVDTHAFEAACAAGELNEARAALCRRLSAGPVDRGVRGLRGMGVLPARGPAQPAGAGPGAADRARAYGGRRAARRSRPPRAWSASIR